MYNASGATITSSAYGNRALFTGREYDSTFGIYEYRARAYHPALGRFMSEDPKLFVRRTGLGKSPDDWSFGKHPDEAEYNLFRYCGNDPEDYTDPMGLTDIEIPHGWDLVGRDATLNSLHEALTRRDGQNLSQLVQQRLSGGNLEVQHGVFNSAKEASETHFEGGRFKEVLVTREEARPSPGYRSMFTGHVHLDVTGKDPHGRRNPSSSEASRNDRKAGLGYRVNESNPNVILRMTPQKEGGPPVERKFNAKTMVPIQIQFKLP